jgi:predicted CopG family antitoxin
VRSTPKIKITEDVYRKLEELANIKGKSVIETFDECIDAVVMSIKSGQHPRLD